MQQKVGAAGYHFVKPVRVVKKYGFYKAASGLP